MNDKVKQMTEELIQMAENFDAHDYRKKAFEELTEIEKLTGKHFPHIAFIIDKYPAFNHIELKVEQPDIFVYKFCINPEEIKKSPKVAESMAEMMGFFIDQGAERND